MSRWLAASLCLVIGASVVGIVAAGDGEHHVSPWCGRMMAAASARYDAGELTLDELHATIDSVADLAVCDS